MGPEVQVAHGNFAYISRKTNGFNCHKLKLLVGMCYL